jgi:hypothetical protein
MEIERHMVSMNLEAEALPFDFSGIPLLSRMFHKSLAATLDLTQTPGLFIIRSVTEADRPNYRI